MNLYLISIMHFWEQNKGIQVMHNFLIHYFISTFILDSLWSKFNKNSYVAIIIKV